MSINNMGNAAERPRGVKRRFNDVASGVDDYGTEPKRRKLQPISDYLYNDLFRRGEGSDVTLEAFGSLWNLHKICLSRVEYFKNMFNGPWSESSESVIKLQFSDELITKEAFSLTMETLYCDKIDFTENIVPHVLATSSWFGMVELVDHTTNFISDNLRLDNTIQSYALAEKYSCLQLRTNCVDFFAHVIFTQPSVDLFREMSVEMMRDVIASPFLFVLHSEQNVFQLLKKWLYLMLNPAWQGSFIELTDDLLSCFSKTDSAGEEPNESILDSDVGKIFAPAFQALRLDHAICSRKFCEILKTDKILPGSWKKKVFEDQWLNLLRIKNCHMNTPRYIHENHFENHCTRFGRVFPVGEQEYVWRWTGFNFGCDLKFSWRGGSLKVMRDLDSPSSLFDSCPSHSMFYKLYAFTLQDNGRKTVAFRTNIDHVQLTLYSATYLIKTNGDRLNYPLYLSCKFLPPIILNGRVSIATAMMESLESLHQRRNDFDTVSMTGSNDDDDDDEDDSDDDDEDEGDSEEEEEEDETAEEGENDDEEDDDGNHLEDAHQPPEENAEAADGGAPV